MTDPIADHPVCGHVDCVRDEPAVLVERSLAGADWTGVYCDRHDPLADPQVAPLFEGADCRG